MLIYLIKVVMRMLRRGAVSAHIYIVLTCSVSLRAELVSTATFGRQRFASAGADDAVDGKTDMCRRRVLVEC